MVLGSRTGGLRSNLEAGGSSVVSLTVGSDQLLSSPIRTSTDGFGAIGVNGTGFPNQADALMSQGAVVVSGDVGSPCSTSPRVFAVPGIVATHK